jgi:hypothetical protein
LIYADPSGQFAFLPILWVAAAGGIIGGLTHYGLQTLLGSDPCARARWDWSEAAFWGTTGGVIGAGIGIGIYGGWWVATQFGWMTPAGAALAAQQAAQNAIRVAQTDAKTVAHIFDNPAHNWTLTGQGITGNWNLIQQTIAANYQTIISSPTPYRVSSVFGDFVVRVTGAVVDGVIRIGSARVTPVP